MIEYMIALFLGLVEGFTEFLPISSTAHLLLLSHFFSFEAKEGSFAILVQMGAMGAIIHVYFQKILFLAQNFYKDSQARHFLIGLFLAFLPAVVIGLLLHDVIKSIFFVTPILICCSLIIGGVILLIIDKLPLYFKYHKIEDFSWKECVLIGLAQCIAMIPGVSRSGATIVTAMLLGADKRTAAEFSFFLALPTLMGACALEIYKNHQDLAQNDMTLIAIGFCSAFVAAFASIRFLLHYVTHQGFSLFAYWRILVGILGLSGLYFS